MFLTSEVPLYPETEPGGLLARLARGLALPLRT